MPPKNSRLSGLEEVLTFGSVLRSAQFNLGSAYMEGVGTIQNDQMALGWFQKGAKNGCQQSMGALGKYYAGGGTYRGQPDPGLHGCGRAARP